MRRLKAAKIKVSLAELDAQNAQASLDAAQSNARSLENALRKLDSEEGTAQATDGLLEEGTTGKGKAKALR